MKRPCPSCGANLDAYAPSAGPPRAPVPGDLSVCFHCGVSLVFNPDLSLRLMMLLEFVQLSDAERAYLSAATAVVLEARLDHSPPERLQ